MNWGGDHNVHQKTLFGTQDELETETGVEASSLPPRTSIWRTPEGALDLMNLPLLEEIQRTPSIPVH